MDIEASGTGGFGRLLGVLLHLKQFDESFCSHVNCTSFFPPFFWQQVAVKS